MLKSFVTFVIYSFKGQTTRGKSMLFFRNLYRDLYNYSVMALCLLILICSSKLLFANDNTIESPCSINLLNVQNVSCHGGVNGLIEVSGTGGNIGLYHYTISSLNLSLNLWM